MKRLIFTIISITILFSCSKDDPIEKTETDLSVSSTESTIIWIDNANLSQQINNALTYNYGNASQNEVEKKLIYNIDSTQVKATINFKSEYQQNYYDNNISNNIVTINLKKLSSTFPVSDNFADINLIRNMSCIIRSNLPSYDFLSKETICVPITFHAHNNLNLSREKIDIALEKINNNFAGSKIYFVLNDYIRHNSQNLFEVDSVSGLNFNDDNNFSDINNNINIYIFKELRDLNMNNTIITGKAHFPIDNINRVYISSIAFKADIDPKAKFLSHELGHFFSLYHTFQREYACSLFSFNCNNVGDGICSTPIDLFGTTSVNEPGIYYSELSGNNCDNMDTNIEIIIKNLMSYSFVDPYLRLNCNSFFTMEQKKRMRFAAEYWKSDLVCQSTSSSEISISPQILDFPDTEVNTSSQTLSFTVSNTGTSSFSITDMINSSSAFEVLYGMSTTINPNSSITFDVRFSPTQAQTYNGTIEVVNDADNSNSSNSLVYLSGTGVNNNQYSEISLSGNLNFGNVEVGQSNTKTFTISNTGNQSMYVSTIDFPSNVYSANWNYGTISGNSSQTVTVTFQPTNEQSYNGTVTVNNNADSGNGNISISGNGVSSSGSSISLNGSLNFGNVDIGSSDTDTFTIQNNGNQSFNVSSISFPSNVYSANWNSGTISGNSSQTVTVTFQPTNEQSYDGTVTVNNNADSGNGNISISGNGVNNNSNTPITPTNTCNSAPVMAVNTVYEVSNFDFSQFGSAYPIDGESYQGGLVKGFYLSIQVPTTQSYKIRIFDVSSNFDPVFGVKYECNTGYYQDMNSGNIHRNDTGYGGNETFYAGDFSSSYTYNLRIYHYYGNDTPIISFKVEVIPN